VSEDLERNVPEADIQQQDADEDVEAHRHVGAPEDKSIGKSIGATEEGPDVEAHRLVPKKTP
jgi:hypothetical protein